MEVLKNYARAAATALFFLALGSLFTHSMSAAPPVKPAPLRGYYLTADFHYSGNMATTACVAGYHMASMYEIIDPSNLKYDTTLGYVVAGSDAGSGPPAAGGWIRGGSGTGPSGLGSNCNTWTSNSSSDIGTIATPRAFDSVEVTQAWGLALFSCSGNASVWCVQD